MHLSKRVHEQRMPIAHTDVHRQLIASDREPLLESLRLEARKPRYRRDAAEYLVMVRHFLDSLGRHTAAAKHPFEERTDIGAPPRTAEGPIRTPSNQPGPRPPCPLNLTSARAPRVATLRVVRLPQRVLEPARIGRTLADDVERNTVRRVVKTVFSPAVTVTPLLKPRSLVAICPWS